MISNTTATKVRKLLFKSEAALTGDWLGEAANPAHQDRLDACGTLISKLEDTSDINQAFTQAQA